MRSILGNKLVWNGRAWDRKDDGNASSDVRIAGVGLPSFCECPESLTLGTGVIFGAGCVIAGDADVSIGKGTIIGARVQILSMPNARGASPRNSGSRVQIGKQVRIGAGAVIGPGVTLADGVVIEAGAVVTTDVSSGGADLATADFAFGRTRPQKKD